MSNGFLAEQNAEQPVPVVEVPAEPVLEVSTEAAPEVLANKENEDEVALQERLALEQMEKVEAGEDFLNTEKEATPLQEAEVTTTAGAVAPPVMKDEVTKEVEKILEAGLGDYFQTLPPEAQVRFQKKGEEVAIQVAGMVRGFKVEVKRVLDLIRNWLLTVPGVNKFFLEQEAKIKTDRILELEHVYHEEAQNKP